MANIINGTDTGSGGLITTGDSSDELQLQTAETARVTLTNTAVVVNEGGDDVDFRVESDTVENALFVEGSSGNVGIGTNSPSSYYSNELVVSTSDNGGITLANSNTTHASYIMFADGTTGSQQYVGQFGYDHNVDAMVFHTNVSERMRITSDGYLRMASGSGGIQFGGDTAAANALDDYEEGTFTPTVSGSSTAGTASYTRQRGIYTKIGNLVNFSIHMTWSSGTGTGNLRLTGLPFTSTSSQANDIYASSTLSFYSNLTVPANHIATALVGPSNDFVTMQDLPTGDGSGAALAYDGAAAVIVSGSYQTDS